MNWEDLDSETLETMADLGSFSPTVHPGNAELKGLKYDRHDGGLVKTYWNSQDLRRIADHCLHVASWLDARAEESKP